MKNFWLNKLKIGKKVRYVGTLATFVGKCGMVHLVGESSSYVIFDIDPNTTLLVALENCYLECV